MAKLSTDDITVIWTTLENQKEERMNEWKGGGRKEREWEKEGKKAGKGGEKEGEREGRKGGRKKGKKQQNIC